MGRKFHREDRKRDGRTKNTTGWRVLNHQQASGNNGSQDRARRIIEGLLERPGAQNTQGRKDKQGSSLNGRLTTGRPWKLEEKGAIEVEGAGARPGQGGDWGEGAGFFASCQPWALHRCQPIGASESPLENRGVASDPCDSHMV